MKIGEKYYVVTGSYNNSRFALVQLLSRDLSFNKVIIIDNIISFPLSLKYNDVFNPGSKSFYEDYEHAFQEFARINNFEPTEYGFIKFLFTKAAV